MLEAGIAPTEVLLPVLKNDDSTCVVEGLKDLNGDLLETFPSVSTKLDLSDSGETEQGVSAEAVPQLKVMGKENAGSVDEIGGQLELAATKFLFDENKPTGDRGIASDVEAANEDECTEPLD